MLVAGVDEAGRGALAGPVVAAAVIKSEEIEKSSKRFLNDSKQLTEKQRDEAYDWLVQNSDYGIGIVEADEIDKIGIKKATNKAMQRAVHKLCKTPDELWVDGRDRFVFDVPSKDFVKGDEKYPCISAASIIAKVTRDQIMKDEALKYPEFSFENHKGYGAATHLDLLQKEVYTPIHRKTYDPLRTILTQGKLF